MSPRTTHRAGPFSERTFYLQEFRGLTLAFAAAGAELHDARPLADVLRVLGRNGTRVVVLSTRRRVLERIVGRVLPASTPRLEASVWRALRTTPRLGVCLGGGRRFPAACREVVLRLQVAKLVWIDPEGGIVGPRGERLSFVDGDELRRLLAAKPKPSRAAFLREVDSLLEGGIAAVNVCTLEGVAEELFTYAGSGTLFTRARYVSVRRLGIDDFDAAHDLFQRGVAEGFLARRPRAEVDRVLASGFGAFVEDRHLAGICALVGHGRGVTGEIASLYTLTRFLGEGVGATLVAFALREARRRKLRTVFACTLSDQVGEFFERQGFRPVASSELPARKWRGYDPVRRRQLRCYAHPVT